MGDKKVGVASNLSKWPPILQHESEYETWKKDITMWCRLTDLPKAKQALVVHLSLSGRAKNASGELELAVLEKDDGLQKLIEKLDSIFLPEKGRRQFSAFHKLYNLRRKDEVKVFEFVSEFEHIYYNFKIESMVLPDAVLALMLLASCNFKESEHHLVMSAISDITYDNMRSAILRIFGHPIESEASISVKSEPVFCVETNKPCSTEEVIGPSETFYTRGRSTFRGRFRRDRGRPTGGRSSGMASSGFDSRGRKTNPVGYDGRTTTCAICKSILHWARDCPHATEKLDDTGYRSENGKNKSRPNDDFEVNFSMFVACATGSNESTSDEKLQSLIVETKNCGIVDSGCSNTVCGDIWLKHYLDNLSEYQRSFVHEQPSPQTFTFGDSQTYMAKKRVTFPCSINGIRGEITADVVDCKIPLLMSRIAMKKMGMVLDFKKDKLFFRNREIDLMVTSSGQYALPIAM